MLRIVIVMAVVQGAMSTASVMDTYFVALAPYGAAGTCNTACSNAFPSYGCSSGVSISSLDATQIVAGVSPVYGGSYGTTSITIPNELSYSPGAYGTYTMPIAAIAPGGNVGFGYGGVTSCTAINSAATSPQICTCGTNGVTTATQPVGFANNYTVTAGYSGNGAGTSVPSYAFDSNMNMYYTTSTIMQTASIYAISAMCAPSVAVPTLTSSTQGYTGCQHNQVVKFLQSNNYASGAIVYQSSQGCFPLFTYSGHVYCTNAATKAVMQVG